MKKKEFYSLTAWKWFRKYTKLFHSKDGYCTCSTCGTVKRVNDKNMHLGHLIKVFEGGASTNFSTAFDFRNTLPQCYQCNHLKGGCELKMMHAINKKFGAGTYDKLRVKSKQWMKLDKVTLKEISDFYKGKFNELTKEKGDPWK